VELLGNGNPTQETVIEWAYRVQLAKLAFIQPDVRWEIRPSGTGRIPDALILGAEFGVTF